MSTIDHVGFSVSDFDRSAAFYEAALAPIGIGLLTSFEHDGQRHAGFGSTRPFFWIGSSRKPAATGIHVAFQAQSRDEVNVFHAAALAAGGADNGAPGLRPIYHANYYGAFVLDPDGNNVEAVFHGGT